MFGWNWDSIAQECTQFLGPAGYGAIQISPPQETVTGDQWWTDYQPVSYKLEGKRGTREQLATMIDACHRVGVKVYADAVINHMTGSDAGMGTAGSSYEHYNYPGIYTTDSFHHCGLAPGDNIADYDNRQQVQTCQLVNLADLATDTPNVQASIAAYLSDLLSLGIDGFRVDAAKHIAATDISAILARVSPAPSYITQEVIFGLGEPITPNEYIDNGNVQEFRYTSTLRDAFSGVSAGIAQLLDEGVIPGAGWLASGDANVFVANHDTERNSESLSILSPSDTYKLAHVFMLAHPYGTPTVLSSYEFNDTDAGAPNGAVGSCFGEGGVNGWLCQHRFPPIAGLTAFRFAVSGAVQNVQKGTAQQVAFARGATGFVALNNEDAVWSGAFSTGLPQGNYCNVFDGARNSTGDCALGIVAVDAEGYAALNVPPRAAVAIYVGAEAPAGSVPSAPTATGQGGLDSLPTAAPVPSPPPSAPKSVSFRVTQDRTAFGDTVMVVGSSPELGSWDPTMAIPLTTDEKTFPLWSATSASTGGSFEYKYLIKTASGEIQWEADPNRSGPPSGADTWQD
ncbi:alpha-amylase-domain-containing protein [Auricularia subglabra TFB-10046 SS5]|uniref:Alpha-amylase n=1 Tax=Auricularia subglabra (strain TFB-10046 / SS5) TaxID=717982 RepID=J0WW10_AURST|nr:alpha-amylase-domain-containing protein [Auricularia subglabra TFB-10046 SS5]